VDKLERENLKIRVLDAKKALPKVGLMPALMLRHPELKYERVYSVLNMQAADPEITEKIEFLLDDLLKKRPLIKSTKTEVVDLKIEVAELKTRLPKRGIVSLMRFVFPEIDENKLTYTLQLRHVDPDINDRLLTLSEIINSNT